MTGSIAGRLGKRPHALSLGDTVSAGSLGAPARVAETASVLAEARRIGGGLPEGAAEDGAWRDVRQAEPKKPSWQIVPTV